MGQQIHVLGGAVTRFAPDRKEHGALENEMAAVLRAAQAVEKTLQPISNHHQVEVIVPLIGQSEQLAARELRYVGG
jgi:hypothetical protein